MIFQRTDMFGYVDMISSSISHHRPSFGRWNPLVSLLVLFTAALIALCFSAQGGAHMFETLQSYIADWPLLLMLINIVVNNVEVCL